MPPMTASRRSCRGRFAYNRYPITPCVYVLIILCSPLFDRPCPHYEQSSLHSPLFPSGRNCVIVGVQNSGSQRSGGSPMTFDDMLAQITDLLKRQGRVSYGALKRRYDLDDAYLEALKDEIIHAQRLAVDEDNRVLVWIGEQEAASEPLLVPGTSALASAPVPDQEREPLSYTPKH